MTNRTMAIMVCGLSWPCVLVGQIAPPEAAPREEEPAANLGRITGVVVHAATGQPVAGAYVGVGDFGDAGGTNLARFERQGLYAHTETDDTGRFELERIALVDHPLVVTHPEYVRHDETVVLRPDKPEAELKIGMQPAAEIRATVVDGMGKPLKQPFTIRLEALDGRRFIPPGKHRHLSTFASATWMEPAWAGPDKSGSFLFAELQEGEYAIDAMKVAHREGATYYGGIARVRVKAGEAKEVQVKPEDHRNVVTVKLSMIPFERPEVPAFLVINRDPALLVWDDGLMHHPEDHRLGRITLDALVMTGFSPSDTFKVGNLPPGAYSLFVGPLVAMKGVRVEVVEGQDQTVAADWVKPEEVARVRLWTLYRRLSLPRETWRAEELCKWLTEQAEPCPEFKVAPSHRDEEIRLAPRERMLWEIVEEVCVQKDWVVKEQGDRILILSPPTKPK